MVTFDEVITGNIQLIIKRLEGFRWMRVTDVEDLLYIELNKVVHSLANICNLYERFAA